MDEQGFRKVIEQGRLLQERLGDISPVAVGGTSVALLSAGCGRQRLRGGTGVNPDRSTNVPSAWRWLNIIQRGDTEAWRELYLCCRHDRAVAGEVSRALEWRDPDLIASARLWAFLLEDLWPDLKIDLHEDNSYSAI